MQQAVERRVWSPRSEETYTRNVISRARACNRRSLTAFAEWLRSSRELAAVTVTVRLGSASTFVDAITYAKEASCAAAFRVVTDEDVERFFVAYARDHGPASRRSMQAAMRLFLQYAQFRGWSDRCLSSPVSALKSYRLSGLPRAVAEDELSALLESTCWSNGRCPKRDKAIVYLLAAYGARRSQVSALRFDDIAWREKAIVFRSHKGGKSVEHSLTNAVAETLSDYICNERPRCSVEHVFLRNTRPHLRLSPAAISALVHYRMTQSGLVGRYPHAFRHAFASRLLKANQSFKTIADLLGHRSLGAVGIYAKLDHARLLDVAVEWPEVTR